MKEKKLARGWRRWQWRGANEEGFNGEQLFGNGFPSSWSWSLQARFWHRFPATMKSVSGDSIPIFYPCACLEHFFIILFGAFFRAPSGCACLIFINILRCLVGFWLFFSVSDLFSWQKCGLFRFWWEIRPYGCGSNWERCIGCGIWTWVYVNSK